MPSSFSISLILFLSGLSMGQVGQENSDPHLRPDLAEAAGNLTEKSEPRSAFLDTSFEAEQALHRVGQLEEDGQWSAAAIALQQVSRKHGRHIFSIAPDRYIGLRDYVARRICTWPPEGLAAWRGAFEAPASIALTAARERGEMPAFLRVADDWFPSHAGATALDLAAQCAAESGDFVTAERAYARLLELHPDRSQNSERWRAKAAIFAARAGDSRKLAAMVKEYTDNRPGPQVTWSGQSRSIGEFLRAELSQPATGEANPGTGNSVATPKIFCGANSRSAVYSLSTEPEARIWKFTGFEPQQDAKDAEAIAGEPSLFDAYSRAVQSGRLLTMMPVYGDGFIYLHDQYTVWAVDPTQPELAAWTFKIREAGERSPVWLHDESIPPFFTSLYHDGRIYVNLETVRAGKNEDDDELSAAMVCLNARTGRLLWRCDLAGFATAFEESALDGAPLLVEGSLYAVGRRRKGFGFESCHLLRIDPADGRLIGTVHLGEAATGSYGYRRATLGHPAANGDLIFVQTNLGSVAAVSAALDRTVWISTYESAHDKDSDSSFGGAERAGQPIRSWNYQPPICWNNALVCMPLDIADVLVLGQDDGRLLRRITGEVLQAPQTLVGIAGDLLYSVGGGIVCYDLVSGRVAWERPLEVGQLFGRGLLTDSGLLVPTDRALLKYPLEGGTPTVYHWPITEAGNLLALRDQLIVAAPNLLYGLVGRDDAFARLTKRLEVNPVDPLAALSLAELAFQTGQMDRGLHAVEESVRRAGGFARLTDDAIKERLYASMTQFADGLLRDRTGTGTSRPGAVSTAIELYRMAGQCTSTPDEQIIQRFQLANALVMNQQFSEAVDAYQQVLADPTLRKHLVAESATRYAPNSNSVERLRGNDGETPSAPAIVQAPAGRLAEVWIDELIRRKGPGIYDATEKRAGDRLHIAQTRQNPIAVIEVAHAFPNSSAAREALCVHARLMRDDGVLEAAIQSFRMALADRRTPERASLIRELADCLIEVERPAEADIWLARGERDFPDARFDQAGRRVGFGEYRRTQMAERDLTSPAFAIGLSPVAQSYERLMTDRVVALEPLYPDAPQTSWDGLVTYSGGQIDYRIPATGRSRWPRPFPLASQPLLVGMDASRYFFATAASVIALTRTSGQTAWQYGAELPDNPNIDPESVPAWAHHVLTKDRLYLASDRGEVVCLELENGTVRWSLKSKAPLTAPIVADDKYLCYATWQGAELHVSVVGVDDGKELNTVNPVDVWPLHALMLTRRHQLLLIRTTAISSVDVTSGKTSWTITAPDHYFLPTLQVDGDALYVSTDARHMSAHDLADGRQFWRSESVAPRADLGMWAEQAGGAVYVAAGDRLQCLDKADGRALWDVPCRGALKVQAPRIVDDAVITVTTVDSRRQRIADRDEATRDEGDQDAAAQQANGVGVGQRYRISRYDLQSGRLLDSAAEGSSMDTLHDGQLVTEPARSFGGIFLREQAIILLDGARIIGYVGLTK